MKQLILMILCLISVVFLAIGLIPLNILFLFGFISATAHLLHVTTTWFPAWYPTLMYRLFLEIIISAACAITLYFIINI